MKTALIVGGSKGIGLVVANTFRNRGDHVVVLSRNKNNWDGDFVEADLTDKSTLDNAITYFKKNHPRLDYLVFCQKNRVKPDDLEFEIKLSLQSTQHLIKKIIPDWMQSGAVVLMGSPAEEYIVQEQPVEYHVGKAALKQLTRYFAVHFGKYGITFNSVLPGTIVKESNSAFYAENKRVVDLIEAITPLKKMGNAQDIANAVAFLCSDQASFITGQAILVDGGRSLEGHESLARRMMASQLG